MPVEIKELHIRAVVGGKAREQEGAVLKAEDISKLKKEISKEVVDKVFQLLKKRNER